MRETVMQEQEHGVGGRRMGNYRHQWVVKKVHMEIPVGLPILIILLETLYNSCTTNTTAFLSGVIFGFGRWWWNQNGRYAHRGGGSCTANIVASLARWSWREGTAGRRVRGLLDRR